MKRNRREERTIADFAGYVSKEEVLALETDLHFDGIEQLKYWRCHHISPEKVQMLPAADVRPVVRGTWDVVEKPLENATICECSECKHRIWMYDGDDGWNYCPHCGAEMKNPNLDATKGDDPLKKEPTMSKYRVRYFDD